MEDIHHHPTTGIFSSSSYDDDFGGTVTNLAPSVAVDPVPTKRVNTIHPQSQILGDLTSPVQTRGTLKKSKFGESSLVSYVHGHQRNNHTDYLHCLFACFLSQLEPSSVAQALNDPEWVEAMKEEMQQFINQKVWKLVHLPDRKTAIGTKWILKNKRDARGIVVRNKARLVAQGHRQEEGIDYDEVFALVARIEAIRLFLAFASYMGFLVYQMDVKSAFLYGKIDEEVYVTQPKGFEDPHFPKHVYKVVKALYGLHQAPRAWYARLSTFLLKHNYRRGTIDKTLFIKKNSRDIILVQVYVDDIIFGSTKKAWCDEFEDLMKGEFEMSAMGELTFFLGLQVKQKPDGIFICQDKYVQDMLKKFDMESMRTATTPYEVSKPKSKDEPDDAVNVHLYRSMIGSLMYLTASRPDIQFAVSACSRHQVTHVTSNLNAVKKIFNDYIGSHGDRKSTTGGCQFLGRRLILWQCKKQTIVATSSTEAEYVASANCCGQVLKIHTDDNVADLLTKAFDGPRKLETDVLNARRSMSSAQAALSSSKGGGYRFSKKIWWKKTRLLFQFGSFSYICLHMLFCNDQMKGKLRITIIRQWREHQKRKRLSEIFISKWVVSIETCAKKGGHGQQELDWDSYEKMEREIALQKVPRSANVAKAKEMAQIRAER
ncbi:putative ribonuclease H-like domain-containing protein [Tanacetum coccineum]